MLSIITDAYGKGLDHAERMRGCSRVIQLMLHSWSGTSSWMKSFNSLRTDLV